MDIIGIIVFIFIGALTGWRIGKVINGGRSDFGINSILGVLGGVGGGFLFRFLGASVGGIIDSVIIASLAGVLLLFLLGFFKKA